MTKVKQKNTQTVKEYLKERLRNIPLTLLMGLFVGFCIASFIYFAVLGGDRSRDCLICLAYLAIVPVFYFAEYTLKVRVPIGFTVFLLLFVLFCFLGACYNFYYLIPNLDDILHAAWGIVFSTVGIIMIKSFLGAPKTAKGVITYVLFGVGFAMLLSVAWEIFEYCGDSLFPDMDMQQDTIVNRIHSFIMFPDPANPAPDNLHTWKVEGIAKTILYDADGNVIGEIIGGYLDLGLVDTMCDLIFCFATTAVFSLILAIDWCKGKYLYRFLIPSLVGEKYDRKGNPVDCGQAQPEAEEVNQPADKEKEVSGEQQPATEEVIEK